MPRIPFLSLSFVVKLRLSVALLLSTVVSLIRIWFRENRLNRSRMGEIALWASINGYRESALLYVAAKLGLADLLEQGSRDSHDLARSVGAHAPSLHRVLRGLVVLGVLSEKQDRRFSLTSLGTWLLSNKRNSLSNAAILCGEGRYHAFGSLIKCVMTGESAQTDPNNNSYEYRGQHPKRDMSFYTVMRRHTSRVAQSILTAYDFHSFHTIADIGGGHGALLAAILKSYPSHTGILFDQPHVANQALHYLERAGVAERCRIVTGDFFDRLQADADLLILKHILHNWDNKRSSAILRNCRQSLDKKGKILLVECLMPARAQDSPETIWLDLWMMTESGGQERTENEYRNLLAAAGFILTKAIPTTSQLWVIEAVCADGTPS
jgi:hypothetical protein